MKVSAVFMNNSGKLELLNLSSFLAVTREKRKYTSEKEET